MLSGAQEAKAVRMMSRICGRQWRQTARPRRVREQRGSDPPRPPPFAHRAPAVIYFESAGRSGFSTRRSL